MTWNASPGAAYYNVYRSPFYEAGEHADYQQINEAPVIGTSFTFVQDLQEDLLAHTGPIPVLPYNPTDPQKVAFINDLIKYRLERVEPVIYRFKSPSYFKVQACNHNGCSELSEADFGQPEFIHTPEYSEIVPIIIMVWGENLLKIQADVPGGTYSANWCGMDICGYDGNGPGGIVMARLKADTYWQMVDREFQYNDFVNGADLNPHPYAVIKLNGLIEGRMYLPEANQGIYRIGGDFSATIYNGLTITGRTRMHIGGRLDASEIVIPGGRCEGWVSITYKGVESRYTMPINPAAVQDPTLGYLQDERPVPTSDNSDHGWNSVHSGWNPYMDEGDSTVVTALLTHPLVPFATGITPEVNKRCQHITGAPGSVAVCYVPGGTDPITCWEEGATRDTAACGTGACVAVGEETCTG